MVEKRLCAHSHTEVCWSSVMDWNPLTWEGQGEGLLQFFQVSKNGQSSWHPTGLCRHSVYIKAATHLQFHKHLRSKGVMAGGCGKQSVLRNPFSPYCRFRFPQRTKECVLQVWISSENCLKVPLENGLKECVLQVLVPSENCLKVPLENGLKECVLQVQIPSENGLKLKECTAGSDSCRQLPQKEV